MQSEEATEIIVKILTKIIDNIGNKTTDENNIKIAYLSIVS